MVPPKKPARALMISARVLLAFITVFWGAFSMLSGMGSDKGEAMAHWQNLPNALPWVGLGCVTLISLKWPGPGGALAILAGVASFVFFNAWENQVVLLGISLPVITAGIMLLLGVSGLRR